MKPTDLRRALDRSHETPGATCPRCQRLIDWSSSLEEPGAEPKPGDMSVCFICEAVLEFTADLRLRLMTDAEVAALPNETLLSVLDAIEAGRCLRKASISAHPSRRT